ncbi:MAG TPA: aminoglycoside phosphotransferase family protein [Longimicrobiaceae bacterium]|nr:aminoglycoside phosphotransferase family protein [Longimicrobiaceae bacterium]
MQPDFVQPDGSPIPAELVSATLRSAVGPEVEPPSFTLENHGQFSNDLAVATLADGRRMIVKRGRYAWSAERFDTARRAAGLFGAAGITTPRSVDLPAELSRAAVDAYWRIELPTLAELWPELGPGERRSAMRSLGRLMRKAHTARLPGHGELRAMAGHPRLLSQVLAEDLGGRLMPAVGAEWPDGVPLVDCLLGMIPEVARRAGEAGVLLHGDLHMGNVVCERAGGAVACTGLLDLECAHAGPAESDLARLAVMHTDLFGMPAGGPWLEWVREGYGEAVDPVVYGFYVVYQLAQLGFHSAWLGHHEHAASVAAAARPAAAALPALPQASQHVASRSPEARGGVLSAPHPPAEGELVPG